MHPYLTHLMAENHLAELRREADEYRRAHPRHDAAPQRMSLEPCGPPPSWFRWRARVQRGATT